MSEVTNPTAIRLLTCKLAEQTVEAIIFVGIPYEDEGVWVCEYGIYFKRSIRKHTHKIVGEDSMQALQLAMAMLGSTLLGLEGTSDWQWNGESYTGLPTNIREPLFGDMPL